MEAEKHSPATIDEYIAAFPEAIQTRLQEIRQAIRSAAPEAVERISYQMPTFYLNGNLVHFAAHKNHIGFYPTPSAIQAFRSELSAYHWAKGSVQFSLDQPLPLDLITRMVKFRREENLKRPKTRGK